MQRLLKIVLIVLIIFAAIVPLQISAQSKLEILFFYSPTCPHCQAEEPFLDSLEDKYPALDIQRYIASDNKNQQLLYQKLTAFKATEYFGSVPVTFIGDELFMGFDNVEGIGKNMENSIIRQLAALEDKAQPSRPQKEEPLPGPTQSEPDQLPTPETAKEEPQVTTAGIDGKSLEKYSLTALSVGMGTLDGFNVCSLGALLLILSLVLVLRSRRQVFLYGGIFLLTTALVYGLLIVFWHQLFAALGQYVRILDFALGTLGIFGAIYFFREFWRFKKYGPACEVGGAKLIGRMSNLVERSFGRKANALLIAGSILLFAAVVTLVEFPCSAAVPVMFAGILAKANLAGLTYLGYLLIFLIFYLFDELLIFGVAVWKMSLWLTKGKFVIYAALIQAILLLLLGGYYLMSFVR